MDETRAKTSKKADDLKQSELSTYTLTTFTPLLVKSEDLCIIVRCKVASTIIHTLVSADQSSILEPVVKMLEGTSSSSSTTPKDKSFNAVQNMRDAVVSAALVESGIELSEHLLLNVHSITMLKKLIALKKEDVTTTLSTPILANFAHWVNLCAENPKESSGTAYILLGLWESGIKKIVTEINKADLKKAAEIVGKWRKSSESEVRETGIEKLLNAIV